MKKDTRSPAEKLAASKKKKRPTAGPVVGVHRCNVRKFREELGLTIDDVYKACGMSKTAYWQVERGRETTLTTARKLAKFFQKSIDDLWPTTPEEQRP